MNNKEIKTLTKDFQDCQKILHALGDSNRQHMILEMLKIGDCNGVRVNTIAAKSNLSRASVSAHLRVLKEAGILKVRKEGTKNYYYFDPDMEAFSLLANVLKKAIDITTSLPNRNSN